MTSDPGERPGVNPPPKGHDMELIDRALTVQQPYTLMIADLFKGVENRGQNSWFRGPIAIHAASAPRWSKTGESDPRVLAAFAKWMYPHQQARGRIDYSEHHPLFQFGAVIAVANVIGCHMANLAGDCCGEWGDAEYRRVSGTVRAWHIELADVVKLAEPVAARGQQAVPWTLPVGVAKAVTEQVALAVTS